MIFLVVVLCLLIGHLFFVNYTLRKDIEKNRSAASQDMKTIYRKCENLEKQISTLNFRIAHIFRKD